MHRTRQHHAKCNRRWEHTCIVDECGSREEESQTNATTTTTTTNNDDGDDFDHSSNTGYVLRRTNYRKLTIRQCSDAPLCAALQVATVFVTKVDEKNALWRSKTLPWPFPGNA